MNGVSVALLDLDDTGHPAEDTSALTEGDVITAEYIGDAVERHRFLAIRREVRMLLGDALGVASDEVPIRRGSNGKPEIAGAALHFAVSSRGPDCAVALCGAHPVGVQVAPVRPDPPVEALMMVLPARVRFAVLNAADGARPLEFARWWCRMEAAVKARGAGLDDAQACLDAVPQETGLLGPDLVVGVAGHAVGQVPVRWDGALVRDGALGPAAGIVGRAS